MKIVIFLLRSVLNNIFLYICPVFGTLFMRIFLQILLISFGFLGFSQQKNILLDKNFWKENPSLNKVKEAVNQGNSPSELDKSLYDPTSLAILQNASEEVILFLLEQEGNYTDKITHDGRTYLHWAAIKGNEKLANLLINRGFNINFPDDRGMPPLVYATHNGQTKPQLYEIFFKNGINPLKKYGNGETILHIAISADNDLSLYNYLISKGLSDKDTDNQGRSVLDYAAKRGNIKIIDFLRNKNIPHTSNFLIFASQGARKHNNTIEVFEYAIEKLKISVNSVDNKGKNALHHIVNKSNQSEIISYLLSMQINVNQEDSNGNTPFILSASNKNSDVFKQLFPYISNINHSNKKGQNSLHFALLNGSSETAEFLLENGATPQSEDKNGNNLAYYWIESFEENDKNFRNKQELLEKYKVNFSKNQQENNTILHLAVLKNNLELLKSLEKFKININQQNNEGETALHKASMIAHNDLILKYLTSKGANKKLKTNYGETAFDLAKENEILQAKNISINFLK